MRVLIMLDVPDYKSTAEVQRVIVKLSEEVRQSAWQELSATLAGWEIVKPPPMT